MPDNDQMNDSAVLRELRNSLSGVAIPEQPRVEAITARGRARRRHQLSGLAGLSVVGAAAGTALVLGLTGVLGPAPARSMSTIRTAAFTIIRNTNGTATLTINPEVLFEPVTLQNDLVQYGIPAMVTVGTFCSSDPEPAGFSQVVSFPPFQDDGGQRQAEDRTITINPALMPAGTELSFGNFQLANGRQTTITLIDTSSYTCSSTVPTTLPSDGALLHWPGQAGS
jgi:hypothetical protein